MRKPAPYSALAEMLPWSPVPPKMEAPIPACFLVFFTCELQTHADVSGCSLGPILASSWQKDLKFASTSNIKEVKIHYKRGFPKYRKTTQKMMNSHECNTCSLLRT